MGHSSIETTQVYLHCLPRLEERLTSPLDAVQNIMPIRPAISEISKHRRTG
jgi:hypothetical protein